MKQPLSGYRKSEQHAGDLRFAVLTSLTLLIAHAIAFMLHEYSHAVVAWLLGFKSDPLALHYGHLSVANILLQQDIDENVDYAPIFATGNGFAAAVIALAGPGVGNAGLYCACAWLLRRRAGSSRPGGTLFLFWLALMACGNLWSYAPIRTITTHGDMAIAAKGLGISPLVLFPFVVGVTILAGLHFFRVVLPQVMRRMQDPCLSRGAFIAAVACFIYFGFYGCPALVGDYGPTSAVMSIASLFVLFPVVLMMSLRRVIAGQEVLPGLEVDSSGR